RRTSPRIPRSGWPSTTARVVFHFTPTGASWLNTIEIWNGIITRQLIRRGTHTSVKVLNADIRQFVANWNSYCKPVSWKVTADKIIEKVRRVTAQLDRLQGATEIGQVIKEAAQSRLHLTK